MINITSEYLSKLNNSLNFFYKVIISNKRLQNLI
jgi:hypothetical protein